MAKCLFSYQPTSGEKEYIEKYCRRFFGIANIPELHLDKTLLAELALKTVNQRIAITGVQPKLSVNLEKNRLEKGRNNSRLTIVGLWGDYILKPQHEYYNCMPETEDLTMHLAGLFKIPTCKHALIRASDGSLVYLAKRFDRQNGRKIHVEDFCQLSGFLTEQKYKGSYEKAGQIIKEFCTNKGLDLVNYFELVVFSFLTGNNDMHLKNFSLIHGEDGIYLAPAYDLVNVSLVFPKDEEELGLTLNGKKKKITRDDFEAFGNTLGLAPKVIRNSLERFMKNHDGVADLIASSFLPEKQQQDYLQIWKNKLSKLQ